MIAGRCGTVDGGGAFVADLCFLVDSSTSTCYNDPGGRFPNGSCNYWEYSKKFINNLLDSLVIGSESTHVSVIQFANTSKIVLTLERYVLCSLVKVPVCMLRPMFPNTSQTEV